MRTIAWFVLLATAVACSSSSSNAPAADAAAQPDTKQAQPCEHAAALCAKLAECAPFLLAAGYGDVDTCAARLSQVCLEQYKSPGSGMWPDAILACETALGAASCADVYANDVAACVFHGSYADGAACGDNSQCGSGFCSHNDNLCGVCAAKGGAGAPCPSGSNDQCQSGLVCSSGKLCVRPAGVGAACDDASAPCLAGSFCTAAKTCALTVPAGEPCPGGYLNLIDGTLCWGKDSPSNPQLATRLGTAAPGEPCGLAPADGVPATLCAPGSVAACTSTTGSIDLFGIPTKGLCAAATKDHYTCTAATACMTGAQCINGVCAIPSGRYCDQPDGGG